MKIKQTDSLNLHTYDAAYYYFLVNYQTENTYGRKYSRKIRIAPVLLLIMTRQDK
jgi:hypothetical protein